MIKTKTFSLSSPGYVNLEDWQKDNPKAEILETKIFTKKTEYVEREITIVYKEPEKKDE